MAGRPDRGVLVRQHRVVIAGVCAAAAGLALIAGSLRWLTDPPPATALERALRHAAADSRGTGAARLTRGLRPAPSPQVRRSPAGGAASSELLNAALAARTLARRSSTARDLRNAGIAELLLARYDESILLLERAAAASDSDDAGLVVDLSAAYLERGIARDRPLDLVKALAAAERARVTGESPEGLFNLAVTIERLHLPAQAVAAWQAYLRIDASSSWADEARRRLATLVSAMDPEARVDELLRAFAKDGGPERAERLAQAFPRNARDWIEDTALPRWGDAIASGDRAQAQRWVGRARILAEKLQARSEDAGIRDLTSALTGTEDRGAGCGEARLAEGFRRFGRGRELYERDEVATSGTEFAAAAAALAGCRCTTALTARIATAVVAYFAGRLDEAALQLTSDATTARERHYLSLEARVHWMQGIILGARARFTDSLDEYDRARLLYERTGETDNAAVMHALLADALQTLGDAGGAWRHLESALALHQSTWNPRRQYTTLLAAARAARQYGSPEASRPFYQEIVRISHAWGPPGALVEAHLERARSTSAAGQLAETRRLLDTARDLLAQVSDPGMRWRVNTQLLRARADVSADDPQTTIAALQAAIAGYTRIGSRLQLAGLNLALGRELRRAGQAGEAEAALRQGISVVEEQRMTVIDAQLRVSHFDRAWDLYEEMVGLALERRDPAAAFGYADRGRARTLMDASGWHGAAPSAEEVARALPAGTAAIYYALLPDRWIAWVLFQGRVELVQQGVARARLAAIAERIGAAATSMDEEGLGGALEDAYDAVLRPVIPHLTGATTIIVVPDGPLNSLPFAALKDRRSGSFFGADRPIAVSPNARALMAIRRAVPPDPRRALVLSAALAGHDEDDELPALPGAAEEARRVAGVYHVPVMKGSEHSAESFLAALTDVDVLHFAGHAVANGEFPLLSRLILDPQRAAGVLFAYRFNGLRLRPGATVVLAACDSAAGPVMRGEGALSLARPFVTSGAGTVLASLWPLSDRDAPRLFESFHVRLMEGRSPEEALWGAQDALRRSGDPGAASPLTWGGVVVVRSGLFAPQAQ